MPPKAETNDEFVKSRWKESTPKWLCKPWEALRELKGVYWCTAHDLPLQIVALDGVSLICRIGAERDPYEFSMQNRRMLIRAGSRVRPRPWAMTIEEDIARGNGSLYDPEYDPRTHRITTAR